MTDVPEMIEKVARAIYDADRLAWAGDFMNHTPIEWEQAEAEVQGQYLATARTAIVAMRESTSDMVEAAWPNIMHENARDVWLDMVDAALGNPPVAR